MIVDMGFTEETGMRLIMTRLKEGPNFYRRDCESSLLRTGGNPYSYEVFERQMMVAYGSTDLSEQSTLTYWALKQNGPLRPLLVEMKVHLSGMDPGIRPSRDVQIQHLLDIMNLELFTAVKRRGLGKGGS